MSKKIQASLYIVGVLFIVIISQIVVNHFFMSDDRIMDAFTDTDTNIEESKLDLVVDYGKAYMSSSQREDVLRQLADCLNLSNYSIHTETTDRTVDMKIETNDEQKSTVIEFITITDQQVQSMEYQHFVLLEIKMTDMFADVISYKKIVEDKVAEFDVEDYQCIMKINGSYKGKISEEQRNKDIKSLLQSLQAKRVDSIESTDYYSVYAYTGLVDDYINAAGKRININIAYTYDEEEDKTEVYLATPILNEEF